jgi:two-component system, OmpR family, KDP operon response regulator KdpE
MTEAMHRVLIVEDDPAIEQILSMLFETNGFRVVTAASCELGIRRAQTSRADICILDLGLPDRDGITFIAETRSWSALPIIVLTARTQEDQRLAAFYAGADDYVLKPFSSAELIARVRAIMRRVVRGEHPEALLRLGDTLVHLAHRTACRAHGEQLKLTPLEHRILECLVRHADGIVTYAHLLKEVWGPHQSDMRALRVYVASLRRKLEVDPAQPRYLLTEPGLGYRLVTESDPRAAVRAEVCPRS